MKLSLPGIGLSRMLKRSRMTLPDGFVVWRRIAKGSSRCASRADRRRGVSMNALRRRKLRRAFRGAGRTGSGAMSGSSTHDHPDSNYRMAREALLSRVSIPEANIHAVPTEGLSPEEAAIAYEATLKRCLRRRRACARPAALRRHAAWNR